MKIGILINELAPGSAPKVIGQTFKGLEKLGHKCEALALIDNGLEEKFPSVYDFHLAGIKIRYFFGRRPKWDFRFPGFSFFSLHHILSFFIAPLLIKDKEYDIVIANGQFAAFVAWGMKLFRGIPYIFYVHADPCTYTLKKTYSKTWLRIFCPFIYIFAWGLDKFAACGALASIVSGQLHKERFRKISNGPLETLRLGCFPTGFFRPYNQREKAILTYDRWDIGNKPYMFLGLLENIEKNIKLKIGGFWYPESIREKFLTEVKRRGLEERVELLGPLDEERILELCSRVILHIHLNQEAFGMQTLEAAGCGACVIVPRGSGVADLFEHGINGYFPEEDNFSEAVKYTRAVFSDLNKAEEMGKKAWELAENYTWPNYTKNLEQIIKKYT